MVLQLGSAGCATFCTKSTGFPQKLSSALPFVVPICFSRFYSFQSLNLENLELFYITLTQKNRETLRLPTVARDVSGLSMRSCFVLWDLDWGPSTPALREVSKIPGTLIVIQANWLRLSHCMFWGGMHCASICAEGILEKIDSDLGLTWMEKATI